MAIARFGNITFTLCTIVNEQASVSRDAAPRAAQLRDISDAGGRVDLELLELDNSSIHVAEYLTTLPPRAVFIERLAQATHRAELQIGQRAQANER